MASSSAPMLKGRVAVVTGSSAGMGRAMAARIVEQGGRVVVNARRLELLEEFAAKYNTGGEKRVAVCAGDATLVETMERAFAVAREAFGQPVDLCILNAGRGLPGSIVNSAVDKWEELLQLDVLGVLRGMRVAAKAMLADFPNAQPGPAGATGEWLQHARDIFVVGSTVGRNVAPHVPVYGAAKAAVAYAVEALRREVGPKGIRVSLVEPGIVASEFQAASGYDPATYGALMQAVGPVLQPDDVAMPVVFAASLPAHVHMAVVSVRNTRVEYP